MTWVQIIFMQIHIGAEIPVIYTSASTAIFHSEIMSMIEWKQLSNKLEYFMLNFDLLIIK